MKAIISALAGTALLALAAPISAQTLQQLNPAPMQAEPPSSYTNVNQLQPIAAPSWMQDDGSSSDHPVHNPGDFSADRLNAQVQGGIPVPPGKGFPAEGVDR